MWKVSDWQRLFYKYDNNPKHTASAVKAYLDIKAHNETVSVIGWPSQMPDLKLTEAVRQRME